LVISWLGLGSVREEKLQLQVLYFQMDSAKDEVEQEVDMME
jgi:hypothetical protein